MKKKEYGQKEEADAKGEKKHTRIWNIEELRN